MTWRTLVLTGTLAAGLGLSMVPSVSADPPPWAGVWRHDRHADHDRDDDWRERHQDWHRRNDWDYDRGYRGRGSGNYAAQCGQIGDRIHIDRDKINEIAPTGRHRKALQWYRDDLGNARRDLANCRNRASYGGYRSYDDGYGDDRYDDGRYDPYYGSSGGSFDWKRDWPVLLGGFLGQ